MLPNTIDLAISGATHHFSLSSLADNRSIRTDTSSGNFALPATITCSRSSTGKGNKGIDSYLMRLDMTFATEVDSASNVQAAQTMSAYLVVKVPRGVANGVTAATNMIAALHTLVQTTSSDAAGIWYATRLIKGEL